MDLKIAGFEVKTLVFTMVAVIGAMIVYDKVVKPYVFKEDI